MKVDSEVPVLYLHAVSPVSTVSLAEESGISHELLIKELREQLREHYNNYGTRPFSLKFSPVLGHIIEVTSVIGLIRTSHFLLSLIPKIPKLSLGKCLAMSQEVGTALTNFNNREPIRAIISRHTSYSTIEALAFSFFDSLLTIKNNGYARRFEEVFVVSAKAGANIDFQLSISQAQLLPPILSELEPTIDTFPNQVLKAAYDQALTAVKSSKLKKALLQLRDDFSEITNLESTIDFDNLLLHYFAFRRADYERALKIALSILNGNTFKDDGYVEFLPAFTIDLDRLFEEFVATIIKKLLSTKKYDVLTQAHFEHDARPALPGEIVPDLLIYHKGNGKKILLDIKNKYSGLREIGQFSVANPDLYQMTYYSLNLEINNAILIFPSTSGIPQYPIRFSESEKSYNEKISKFLMINKGYERTMISKTPCKYNLYIYNIDLSRTMENTFRSVASLCLFAEYLLER